MTTDEVRTELAAENQATLNLLSALPADRLNWQPHEKAMTLGQLARHVATIPGRYLHFANSGETIASTIAEHPAPSSKEAILSLFEESQQQVDSILEKAGKNWLQEHWKLLNERGQIAEMTRAQFIRTFVLNHLYHHRGELTTYIRALNVPVPSVYGPTADVNPFA